MRTQAKKQILVLADNTGYFVGHSSTGFLWDTVGVWNWEMRDGASGMDASP